MTDLENIRERIRSTLRKRGGKQEEGTYMIQCGTDRLCTTSMTPTAKRDVTRGVGERRGNEARVESATEKADERVTIRGSYQRLFCGFDPHWLANGDRRIFSPRPTTFRGWGGGGEGNSPPSSFYLSSRPASCHAPRIPSSVSCLSFPPVPAPDSRRSPKFSIRTLSSFLSKDFLTRTTYRIDDTTFRFCLSLSLYL